MRKSKWRVTCFRSVPTRHAFVHTESVSSEKISMLYSLVAFKNVLTKDLLFQAVASEGVRHVTQNVAINDVFKTSPCHHVTNTRNLLVLFHTLRAPQRKAWRESNSDISRLKRLSIFLPLTFINPFLSGFPDNIGTVFRSYSLRNRLYEVVICT